MRSARKKKERVRRVESQRSRVEKFSRKEKTESRLEEKKQNTSFEREKIADFFVCERQANRCVTQFCWSSFFLTASTVFQEVKKKLYLCLFPVQQCSHFPTAFWWHNEVPSMISLTNCFSRPNVDKKRSLSTGPHSSSGNKTYKFRSQLISRFSLLPVRLLLSKKTNRMWAPQHD